jgi:hypothetical protein
VKLPDGTTVIPHLCEGGDNYKYLNATGGGAVAKMSADAVTTRVMHPLSPPVGVPCAAGGDREDSRVASNGGAREA